jgi:hypothetical protein
MNGAALFFEGHTVEIGSRAGELGSFLSKRIAAAMPLDQNPHYRLVPWRRVSFNIIVIELKPLNIFNVRICTAGPHTVELRT